jgi:anti-sigma-K factor RskA
MDEKVMEKLYEHREGILDQMFGLKSTSEEFRELDKDLQNVEKLILDHKNYELEVRKVEESAKATAEENRVKDRDSKRNLWKAVIAATTATVGYLIVVNAESVSAVTSKAFNTIPKLKID